MHTDDLEVGYDSDGRLDITNGGQVTNVTAWIGKNSGKTGEVTVDGPGSTWTNIYDLYVGYAGSGTLNITSGGQVNGNFGYVGNQSGSTGLVRVDGEGSMFQVLANFIVTPPPDEEIIPIGGDLKIGNEGIGTLEISNGARVISQVGVIGVAGDVSVDGADSIWEVQFACGTFNCIGGTIQIYGRLNLGDGGIVSADESIQIESSGQLAGSGDVRGDVLSDGRVAPGTSPGILHVDGDYTQTGAGELLIQLASASSYDELLVNDNATLAGTLTVNLTDGFVPNLGQSFTILTANDVDGTFTTEVLPDHPSPNLAFDVMYNAQSVVLTVVPALPGDYNADGIVDTADYVVWRKGLGTLFTPGDYDVWRVHFGQTASSGAGASANVAIPEPTTLILVLMGILGLLSRRHITLS
jgi:T5SS/PEP-CTERM-associated repeat protein